MGGLTAKAIAHTRSQPGAAARPSPGSGRSINKGQHQTAQSGLAEESQQPPVRII